MIIFRKGDLFDFDHQAYAHGVNSRGRMDAGIAVRFKGGYPKMFEEYSSACADGILKPGDIFFYHSDDKPSVYNLVTQKNLRSADAVFLEQTVQKMYIHSMKNKITDIGMPLIGCGLGGLSVDTLTDILGKYFTYNDTDIILYSHHAAH